MGAYLPWFEVQTTYDPITIHHLLTHTAGIVEGSEQSPDTRYEVYALRDTQTAWPPGSRFYYSSIGYKVLGLVLEAIEGKPYPEIVQDRILEPLDLNDTEPATTHEVRARMTIGYTDFYDDRPWLPGHAKIEAPWIETDSGDGCIVSTPADLAVFVRMILNRGEAPHGRLISEASLGMLSDEILERDPDPEQPYDLLGHAGAMPGHWARMLVDPRAGVGVAYMANALGNGFKMSAFALGATRSALGSEPLPAIPTLTDPREIENAAEYAGIFRPIAGTGGPAFELIAEDRRLFMSDDDQRIPVWDMGDDAFVVDHPDFCRFPLRFDLDADGSLRVRNGSRKYQRVGASPGATKAKLVPEDSIDRNERLTGHYRSHNPWLTNFRIVEGWGDELIIVMPDGGEQPLHERNELTFRVGDTPETVRFDSIIEGQARRANYSGCNYYRFFTD